MPIYKSFNSISNYSSDVFILKCFQEFRGIVSSTPSEERSVLPMSVELDSVYFIGYTS